MAPPPWMKLYPVDEQRDTKYLSLIGRGLWISVRSALWKSPTKGELTLTIEQWCRELSCSEKEFLDGLHELESYPEMADWSIEHKPQDNGPCKTTVRLSCLSMMSNEYNRLQNSKYQRNYRSKVSGKGVVSGQVRLEMQNPGSPSALPLPPNETQVGERLSLQEREEGIIKIRSAPAKKVLVTLPDDFALTPELEAYARRCGVTDPVGEFEKFCDRNRAHGARYLDWTAALRVWFRNVREFSRSRRRTIGGGLVQP